MPGKKSASARKGQASTRKGGKGPSKAPKASHGLPGFEPFVNRSAGLAALGVRVGFPAQRTVELNFCDSIGWVGSTGSLGKYVFALNSCYDPNVTGTGQQPLGFDQWSLFYNHYVVEECTYSVSIFADAVSHVMTYISDDTTTPTNTYDLMALGGQVGVWQPGTPSHIFEGKVNLARFFNRKDIAADSDLRALTTANPTELAYLTIGVQDALQSTNTVTAYALVKLTYKVRFMEPKDLAPSALKGPPAASSLKPDGEYEYVRVKRVEGSQFPSMKTAP
jgi:hypothetical protein